MFKFKVGDEVEYTGKGWYFCDTDATEEGMGGCRHPRSGYVGKVKIIERKAGNGGNSFMWYRTNQGGSQGNWHTEDAFEYPLSEKENYSLTY